MSIQIERQGAVTTVIIDRPAARNAIDRATALALEDGFREFDADSAASDVRLPSYELSGLPLPKALQSECRHGAISLNGADRFKQGDGRHGRF